MPNSSSFTTAYPSEVRELVTVCAVTEAFDPANAPTPAPTARQYLAIWDTGATSSAITQKVVDELGLSAIGIAKVQGVSGAHDSEVFMVNISLPNRVSGAGIRVTKANLGAKFDLLIGMDIIGKGDFAVTSRDGKTVMSFRFPSSKCIDFVEEHKRDSIKELVKKRPASQVPRKKKSKKRRY